jgi:hypothetical protein
MAANAAVILSILLQMGWAAGARIAVRAPLHGRASALPPGISAPASNAAAGLRPLTQSPSINPVELRPTAIPPAPSPAAISVPMVNPGQTVLERLGQDLPQAEKPADTDLQGQKDFSDRNFEYKLGTANCEPNVVQTEDGSDIIGRRKQKPAPSPDTDDGGGPGYPRRQVQFNGRSFSGVSLRPNIPVEEQLIEAIDASQKSIRIDRKSTRLNSSHNPASRMPSSA